MAYFINLKTRLLNGPVDFLEEQSVIDSGAKKKKIADRALIDQRSDVRLNIMRTTPLG